MKPPYSLLNNLVDKIRGLINTVQVLLCADDLASYDCSCSHVRQALTRSHSAMLESKLTTNLIKPEAMRFRRGDRVTIHDTLYLLGRPLTYVNGFSYPDLLTSYNNPGIFQHFTETCRRALIGLSLIHNTHELLL